MKDLFFSWLKKHTTIAWYRSTKSEMPRIEVKVFGRVISVMQWHDITRNWVEIYSIRN